MLKIQLIFPPACTKRSTLRLCFATTSPLYTTLSYIYISWQIQRGLLGCQMSVGDQITFINTWTICWWCAGRVTCACRLDRVSSGCDGTAARAHEASWLGPSSCLCRCWKAVVFLHINSESLWKQMELCQEVLRCTVTLMAKRAWTMELICSLFGILRRHPMDCRSKCQMSVTYAALGHYLQYKVRRWRPTATSLHAATFKRSLLKMREGWL